MQSCTVYDILKLATTISEKSWSDEKMLTSLSKLTKGLVSLINEIEDAEYARFVERAPETKGNVPCEYPAGHLSMDEVLKNLEANSIENTVNLSGCGQLTPGQFPLNDVPEESRQVGNQVAHEAGRSPGELRLANTSEYEHKLITLEAEIVAGKYVAAFVNEQEEYPWYAPPGLHKKGLRLHKKPNVASSPEPELIQIP